MLHGKRPRLCRILRSVLISEDRKTTLELVASARYHGCARRMSCADAKERSPLCCLTFEVSWRRRRGALDSKRKMAAGPALYGQCGTPLALSLTEWLGSAAALLPALYLALQACEQ